MKIVVDLNQHQAIADFTINQAAGIYDFKSQDTIDWRIYFVLEGIVQDMGAGFALKFGMVANSDLATLLAYQTVSSHQTDSDGNVYYLMQVNFNTSQMATAITGKTQLPCTIEIRYQTSDSEIIHTLNIAALVFPTLLPEAGTTPPSVPPTYPDPSTLELVVHKNANSGYAGLDASGHLYPSVLVGVEMVANKNQPSGYPSLDVSGLIPATEIPVDGSTIVIDGATHKLTAPAASGDMRKETYDTANTGNRVDHAQLADTATSATTATTAGALVAAGALGTLSQVWGKDAGGNQGLFAAGTGDMTKATYDSDNNGACDVADALRVDGGAGASATQVWGKDASGKQAIFPAPSGGGLSDAPSDGNTYGRKNAAWAVVPTGGGGITDAPSDGKDYLRNGSLPGWRALKGESLAAHIETPAVKEYWIDCYVPDPLSVQGFAAICGAGTATVSLKSNGVTITGTTLSVSTTRSTIGAIGSINVPLNQGDTLKLAVTAMSSCADLAVSVYIHK